MGLWPRPFAEGQGQGQGQGQDQGQGQGQGQGSKPGPGPASGPGPGPGPEPGSGWAGPQRQSRQGQGQGQGQNQGQSQSGIFGCVAPGPSSALASGLFESSYPLAQSPRTSLCPVSGRSPSLALAPSRQILPPALFPWRSAQPKLFCVFFLAGAPSRQPSLAAFLSWPVP